QGRAGCGIVLPEQPFAPVLPEDGPMSLDREDHVDGPLGGAQAIGPVAVLSVPRQTGPRRIAARRAVVIVANGGAAQMLDQPCHHLGPERVAEIEAVA